MSLPLFPGLYTDDLIGYAKQYNRGVIMRALPSIEKEIKKLPREYLANLIQTIAKDNFTRWCKVRIEARNKKLTDDRDLAIHMDQSIAAIFNASNAISGKLTVTLYKVTNQIDSYFI